MKSVDQKVAMLAQQLKDQFQSRVIVDNGKRAKKLDASMVCEKKDNVFWVSIKEGDTTHVVEVPIPVKEGNVWFINHNEVKRPICSYYLVNQNIMLSYMDAITSIVLSFPTGPEGLIPPDMVKKTAFTRQIAYAFNNGTVSLAVHRLQRAIDWLVGQLPLHRTEMNSYIMNQKVVIIDPVFDVIASPEERHAYQVEKSKKYFPLGWSTIGLSDGVLSDKNYILKEDLRKTIPFGIKHHNPQRNLYSTLGMKGDELPLVRSRTEQNLINQGISRKGWNLFTLFIDIPDTWEDQIMADISLTSKSVSNEKRHLCFGELLVKEGDKVKRGDKLSSIGEEATIFDTICESAFVEKVSETLVTVGGTPTRAHNVIINFTRTLKEGYKITNHAANKGCTRYRELGYAIDPRTGERRKIDVIVAAKAVEKRKNYSQLLEAITNVVNNDRVIVVADDCEVPEERIAERLRQEGLPEDGTWECHTYMGVKRGVCGNVFWGVTHDVEDMLWEKEDTERLNGKGLREAGLKFSPVEFRALNTRLGKRNPVVQEILSYAQGSDDLQEQIRILKSKEGIIPDDMRVLDVGKLKVVDQSKSTIVTKELITDTVADEFFMAEGFALKLPITYQVVIDAKGKTSHEGAPFADYSEAEKVFTFDKIYIPSGTLRRSWRHASGKYGLSDVAVHINNIVLIAQRYIANPLDTHNVTMLYNSVAAYFKLITNRMSTKFGDVSILGMSVRYPHSAKGTAVLSNALPKNTIEIHTSMAKSLGVKTGDVVLVERFPCLGFMSLRIQKIKVHNDPLARYTIRVSGNSLGSQSLDFDGDQLYIAAFFTKEAKQALLKEWTNPNKSCYDAIKALNKKMGRPEEREMSIKDFNIKPFPALTVDSHADIVSKATGVKSFTGPVIALAYNLMRIVESSPDIKDDQKTNTGVELFLDKVGNSIFKQKHGVKPLHKIVVDAICTADVETLVAEGFGRGVATVICNALVKKAAALGKTDLVSYHKFITENKGGNIISRIVRENNKLYFASRATMNGYELLRHLEAPAVDIPSKIFKWVLAGKQNLLKNTLEEKHHERKLGILSNMDFKEATVTMCEYIDRLFTPHIYSSTNKPQEVAVWQQTVN